MVPQMGTKADTSICRRDTGKLELNGDLIVDGMSTKDMLKTIQSLVQTIHGLEKRVQQLEKNMTGL